MELINKIYTIVNKEYIAKKNNVSFISLHFNQKYNEYNSYTYTNWDDVINFKYHVFKNYYFHPSFTINDKYEIITMLYNVNKILIPLYKFKNQIKKKCRKYKGEQLDLNFNILNENDKNTMLIIDKNNYLFNIFDLIKIRINIAISKN